MDQNCVKITTSKTKKETQFENIRIDGTNLPPSKYFPVFASRLSSFPMIKAKVVAVFYGIFFVTIRLSVCISSVAKLDRRLLILTCFCFCFARDGDVCEEVVASRRLPEKEIEVKRK